MDISWRIIIPVLIVFTFIIYEEWVSTPACEVAVPSIRLNQYRIQEEEDNDNADDDDGDGLKVMMVANMLLLGSEAGFFNTYFRDYYMAKFFRKSFASLNPDMLIVLGDVSAKGHKVGKNMWYSVLQQFHARIGPFYGLPLHVVLGDRDVGECSKLDKNWVSWVASRFPGLDSAGSGAFEISNISFVSLNAVALLCGNNDLRFNVEKMIERERTRLQIETEDSRELIDQSSKVKEAPYEFQWRENALSLGSGPTLLVHFPLHQIGNINCSGNSTHAGTLKNSIPTVSRGLAGNGPYEASRSVPPNATEYILQALRPRIVFSAHRYEFCVHIHPDGTHEVSVPATAWDVRDDPGFVLATYKKNGGVVTISHCSLAKESHIFIAYISALVFLASMMLVLNKSNVTILT